MFRHVYMIYHVLTWHRLFRGGSWFSFTENRKAFFQYWYNYCRWPRLTKPTSRVDYLIKLSKISSWKLVSLTLSICRLINIWQYLRWFGNTTYTRKSILPLIHKLQYRDCGAQSCIHQIVKLPLLEKQKGLGVWGLGGLLGLSGLGGKGARLGCPGWQAKEAWPGG